MTKLNETVLSTQHFRLLGRVLIFAIRAQRKYARARREFCEFLGCDPECDDWLVDKSTGNASETLQGEVGLGREFVDEFGDTECDDETEPPGM